jgi:hypothetical protein
VFEKERRDSEEAVNLVEPGPGQRYHMGEVICEEYTFLLAGMLLVEGGENICIPRV